MTITQSSPATSLPQVRVELRSNPLYLSGVRELVSSVAKRLGFADDVAGQMALAVDEALCNVIRHGYGKASDRPIWLSIFPEGGAWSNGSPSPMQGSTDDRADAIRIVIEDEATQVDPANIRSRDLDEVRPGGLGVHIIKTVMDQATYEKRGPVGMRLTMVKKREAAKSLTQLPTQGGCCGGGGGGRTGAQIATSKGQAGACSKD